MTSGLHIVTIDDAEISHSQAAQAGQRALQGLAGSGFLDQAGQCRVDALEELPVGARQLLEILARSLRGRTPAQLADPG